MAVKKVIIYILLAFIAVIFVLIFIQYKSTKNILILIDGNEKFLREYKINREFREIKRDLVYGDSSLKRIGTLLETDSIASIENKIKNAEDDIKQLQKIADDDYSVKYIDLLDTLIHRKIEYIRQLRRMAQSGAPFLSGDSLYGFNTGKRLNDSILLTINKITDSRQKLLEKTTLTNDESGKTALDFAIILSILVLISAAALFWYIINIIRKQSSLIQALNISEKKVKESARVKENFMANMSHEIRTPMNAILGFTSLLQKKPMDDQSKEYVQTIHKSGENLLAIVNDILDLSKIEAGMMRIESAAFDIRELFYSVEALFKEKANKKNISITTLVDDRLPLSLEGDAMRLSQILINLVGNSIKFTSDGSIRLEILQETQHANEIQTVITVTDTGIGIDPDNLKHIFDRFQQAEDSSTRNYGGTGLGLSIVKELVALQKGTITVRSILGEGTVFKIHIPFNIASSEIDKKASEQVTATQQQNITQQKILVVEDNEINQSLIRHLFNNWQLEFDIVNNGKEALNKLVSSKYTLVLLDMQMPVMDGYTTTKEIRERLKSDIPIIAMTAHAFAGEREKCLNLGMNEYISKPIRENDLYRLILQFAKTKKGPREQQEPAPSQLNGKYHFIQLQYMKEVSNGNIEYEKTVTGQFLEAVPEDLSALESAWIANDQALVKAIAHNMKTTVSIMGLDLLLQPALDTLEYDQSLTTEKFQQHYHSLKTICLSAMEEASQFYLSLQ